MSWLSELFGAGDMTFDQELELLIARWTDMSRKGTEALTINEICDRLKAKAGQLDYHEKTKPPGGRR